MGRIVDRPQQRKGHCVGTILKQNVLEPGIFSFAQLCNLGTKEAKYGTAGSCRRWTDPTVVNPTSEEPSDPSNHEHGRHLPRSHGIFHGPAQPNQGGHVHHEMKHTEMNIHRRQPAKYLPFSPQTANDPSHLENR